MAYNEITRRVLMQIAMAMGGTAAFSRMALSQDGKVLRIRYNRDIQSVDPGFMIGGIDITMQTACLTNLANYAPGDEWAWVPGAMVETIEQTDNLNIHFKLKPGYQWSDGYGEVTAEDVKYSLDRGKHGQWNGKYVTIDHVEVLGTHEGIIVLNKPFSPLWLTMLCDGTGSIVCKKAVEATGYDVDSAADPAIKVKRYDAVFPAQCGPYRIANWVQKQRVELGINPDWIGEKPTIETIHIIIVEDEKAAELGYEAGDVDMTSISVDSLSRYRETPPPNTKLKEVAGLRWTWMGMNTEHPKLADHRVREAICLAVDVDSILAGAYGGLAPRSYGIVPPGLIGHRETSKYAVRDVEKAKALVAEAGAEGLEIRIDIINKTDMNSAASIIQANLAEIGINLVVNPLDSGVWWTLGLESEGEAWKDLQLYIARFGDAPDPSQMTQWYVASQVGVWNWERWKNAEFDKLDSDALAEVDPAKRDAIYVRMQEIMDDTAAYVWITHEPIPVVYRDSFNPVIHPDSQYYLPRFTWA